MKEYFIYKITNTVNNKIYIGQSLDPKKRWYKHKYYARTNTRDQVLYTAMRKHGIDNFIFEICFKYSSLEEVNKAEEHFIALFNSTNRKIGYNVSLGGDNKTHSIESRLKMSKALLGRSCSPNTEFKIGHFQKKGEASTSSKLTDTLVLEIKKLFKTDMLHMDIAKMYNLSGSTISNLFNNKKWQHVLLPEDLLIENGN